jgi:hypothetical protein
MACNSRDSAILWREFWFSIEVLLEMDIDFYEVMMAYYDGKW